MFVYIFINLFSVETQIHWPMSVLNVWRLPVYSVPSDPLCIEFNSVYLFKDAMKMEKTTERERECITLMTSMQRSMELIIRCTYVICFMPTHFFVNICVLLTTNTAANSIHSVNFTFLFYPSLSLSMTK